MRSNTTRLTMLLILSASLACKVPSISGTEQSYGPCDNVLYPLFIGAHWVYRLDKQDGSEITKIGLTVTKVANSQATIESLAFSSGITTQVIADCDNGAIRNFPVISQNMLIGNALASDLNMEYVAGEFAPGQSAFTDNDWSYQWVTDYIISGTIQAQVEGETLSITLQDTPLHMAWQTTGSGDAAFEPITVPAGSFESALKINNEISMDITVPVAGLPVTGRLTLRTTQWYEPFTGLLKSQIDSGEVSTLGIKLPIAVKGTIELVEYLTAH